jgi:hypothetical protein
MPVKTNLLLGLKFGLFGAELTAGYKKEGDINQLFISPSDAADNDGITIAKLITDIETLLGCDPGKSGIDETAVKAALNPENKNDQATADGWSSLKIKLQTVYLKKNWNPAKTSDAVTAFALRFDVDAQHLLPTSVSFIEVKSLTFAVWSDNIEPKIADRLALTAG